MPWKCLTCSYSFEKKQNYDRHLKTTRHIKRTQSEQELFICNICNKKFSHRCSLINHQKKKCKSIHKEEPETEIEIMKKKIELFEKERNEMKAQIALLLEKNTINEKNTTNHIQTQNNIENQSVNIVVNSFGHENIDHLTDQIICKIIKTAPFTSVPLLIKKIHFDPDHPENHNIKITNKKLNYAEIVRDNKWVTANKKKVIDDVIQKSYELLDEKYSENKEDISEKRQERFQNFQEKYEQADEELLRNIKNDVDLLMINGT